MVDFKATDAWYIEAAELEDGENIGHGKPMIYVEPSAWQFVLDALDLKLDKGKTIQDIKSIDKKSGITYK